MDEAACYFRHAVRLRPSFIEARHNLENVCCHVVERWHFRMLNDERRNRLYRDAIRDAVAAGGRTDVLDIGTGTGLLRSVGDESVGNKSDTKCSRILQVV